MKNRNKKSFPISSKLTNGNEKVGKKIVNRRSIILLPLILASLFFVVSLVVSGDMASPDSYTLGEIDPVLVAREGELLNFTLDTPANLGPDVQWTITSPDLSQEALSRIFSEVPAFPGAEGFGALTRGGRGGKVIKVTNLNTSGPGSFAEALLAEGPRIIVFDVSGVIEGPPPEGSWMVTKSKRFYTTTDPLTIAGQTAPGAGVTLSGQLVLRDGDGGTPVDNVIARFLRIRDPYHRRGIGDNLDGPGNMAVFDHLSGAWGVDENFDFSGLKNGSIQWCGIEEAAGFGDEWEVLIDKDNDGMLDYWEIKVRDYSSADDIKDYILDILPDEDLDGDGASNLQEYLAGSNPLVAGTNADPIWTPGYDSDHDGMFDCWEQKVIDASSTDALNTLADINPEDDLDGDLSTNLEEHNAGTTPLQAPTHNYGMIMGYSGQNVSLHHNFFAHHHTRTPLSGTEVMDHRNNVMYNIAEGVVWHPPTMNQQRPGALFKANLVGNFFKVGPNSMKMQDGPWEYPFIAGSSARIYGTGNYFDMADDPTGYLDIFNPGRLRIASLNEEHHSAGMYKAPYVRTYSAEEAYRVVLAHAGDWPRDAVTLRNIDEIKNRTGKWGREFPSGGLLQGLTPSPPSLDSDNDGMPDSWETAVIQVNGSTVNRGHILNSKAQDHNRIVKSGESVLTYKGKPVPGTVDRYKGYTYIEYYINELADQYILDGLSDQGLDETYLPGYGSEPKPSFSWVPGYDQSGEYTIRFKASNGTQDISQTITIRVDETNRDPYIYDAMYKDNGTSVSTHQVNYIEPGDGLSFEYYVTEPDGENITLKITGAPDGALLNDTGMTKDSLKGDAVYKVYTFDWHPTLADVGWEGTIAITATDNSGGTYTQKFAVKVNPPTNPIHVLSIETNTGGTTNLGKGNVLVQEGDDKILYVYAEDDYRLADLMIDGTSVGPVGKYSFSNITSDHSIRALFESDPGAIGGCILDLRFKGNMKDSSLYGNDGVADEGHSPVLTADRFGVGKSAYEFNGLDHYIRIADDDIFDAPGYTIAAWVYPRKDLYSGQYFVSKNAKSGHDYLGLYSAYDSIYTCGANFPHSEPVLKDRENRWIHIVVSRGPSGDVNFYYNGEYTGNGVTNPNKSNDLDVIIGARNAVERFFEGIIDDVQVYNKVLTSSQVKALYLATKPEAHHDPPVILLKAPMGLEVITVK